MSRSLGGRSLTSSPPMRISPALASSSPAIMRRVVDLPQPEGPTRTTNSVSAMSRSMPRTASVRSNLLTRLRSVTWAMRASCLSLCCARREAGDVVVHEECVDDEGRGRADQRAGHDLPPIVDIALDERRDDADRQYELIRRCREGERVEEIRPGHGEGENRRGDDSGQRHRDEDLGQHLDVAGAVDEGRLVELLRNAGEIADQDP